MQSFRNSARLNKAFLLVAVLALAALLAPQAANAVSYQRAPFASTPNPVGSGARAIGWGGAFIAVADDATAASWNPAGLVQLVTPEASVALSYHSRLEMVDFSGYDVSSESRVGTQMNINYASVVYPFNVSGVNMVVSLNYQRLFEFDRDLEYQAAGINNLGYSFDETRALQQAGALTTVTPAFAVQITPAWSLGLAVNFWGIESGGNGWDQQWQTYGSRLTTPGDPTTRVNYWFESQESYEMTGVNYVIGTHVKIQSLTIGAVYKSSWEADVLYSNRYETAAFFPFNPISNYSNRNVYKDIEETLVWPESYGIGLAWRVSDEFSMAVDANTTRWSNFKIKLYGEELNLLSGDDRTADIQDTVQVRAGAEYLIMQPQYVLAIRGGGFYAPEPLVEEVNDFYGVTLGTGVAYQNFIVDAAVQYSWGNDVQGERISGVEATTDTSDFLGIVSLIYHFE